MNHKYLFQAFNIQFKERLKFIRRGPLKTVVFNGQYFSFFNFLKKKGKKDEFEKYFVEKEEKKDLTAFMSISLNSSVGTIAPSTSKQTETVHSKSFSKHSIQKKKEIKKKRSFFGTKSAFKRRYQRPENLKRIRLLSDSEEKETSKKREPNQRRICSRKGVNKKFKVNNILLFYVIHF